VIAKDDSIDVEPVVDRDTAGVPGAPYIVATIFAKIDAADVVVLDVSLITLRDAARLSPTNPNVLIELGYAVRSKGWQNLVLVMNRAYGLPEHLPFDLRTRRVTAYDLSAGASDEDRKKQSGALLAVGCAGAQ
jgi:hypothetical protein